MNHIKHLRLSWKETFKNPSLIGVGIAQLILLFLIGVLFGLLVSDQMGSADPDIGQVIIYAIFFPFVLSIIAGVFASGFYFMVKNVIQDGSTTIREFIPGVKRYWGKCTLLYLLKNFLVPLVVFTPIVVFIYGNVQGGAALIPPINFLIAIVLGFLVYVLINFFWLLWAVPVIVYKDESVKNSIGVSFRIANKNVPHMALILLISGLIFFVYLALQEIVNFLFINLAPEPTTGAIITRVILDVLLPVIGIIVLVLVSLFIFHSYVGIIGLKPGRGVRPKKARRKQRAR